MRKNKAKQIMDSGQLALGAYVALADPQIVEIIGISGFDAVFIDMEHTAFDLSLVQQMIVAADLVDITPIVRVSDSDPGFILRVLDMGAQGIVIPHVDGLEGAKKAVEAVRYPPVGLRGGAGAMTAAAVGVLSPVMTVPLTIKGLIVTVIGGLGSIPGAIIAGLFVGAFENFFLYIRGIDERDMYVVALLFIFLVFRPNGIFSKTITRD